MDFDATMIANIKIAIASAAGGIVRTIQLPEKSLSSSCLSILGSAICGFYATGPVVSWWNIPTEYAGAVGAVAGCIGLSCAEIALKTVAQFDAVKWLKGRIGGGQ